MFKVYLNIFGPTARHVIYDALCNASTATLGTSVHVPHQLEDDNEVSIQIMGNKLPDDFRKKLIRRLKWYSNYLKEYFKSSSLPPNELEIESKQADCIARMLEGTPIEELESSYDETVLADLRQTRLDPFKTNAIATLIQQQKEIAYKYNTKIEEYMQKMHAERDAKIAKLQTEIEKLRRNDKIETDFT